MVDDFDADFTHLPVSNLRCCRQSITGDQTICRPEGSGDWLILYTHSGRGLVRTPRGSVALPPASLIMFSPGEYQEYGPATLAEPWVHTWVHFIPRPSILPFLQWESDAQGLRLLDPGTGEWAQLDQAFERLMGAFWSHPRPLWKELAFNALEEVVLRCHGARLGQGLCTLDPRIRKAMDILASHMSETFNLKDLAKTCGLSISALTHRFHAETGESPRRFHEHCRLELARELVLYSRQTIGELASQTGFSNPFYFTRRFTQRFGVSPSALRAQYGPGPAGSTKG